MPSIVRSRPGHSSAESTDVRHDHEIAHPCAGSGATPDRGSSRTQVRGNRFWRRRWPLGVVVAWLIIAGGFTSQTGKLAEVVESGATAYLPEDSQSRQVMDLTREFGDDEALPAIIVWSRDTPLTTADRSEISKRSEALRSRLAPKVTAQGVVGPILSADKNAMQVMVPISGTDTEAAAEVVKDIRSELDAPPDVIAQVTGPAGVQADMKEALGAIDLMLVLVTSGLILMILLAVYRSLLLPFLVIGVGGLALGCSQGVIYLLAKAGVLSIGAEVQGITSVLVLGCATDYAMLLIARFDQQLRLGDDRRTALAAAWRSSLEPIVASAATVILGLLCLLLSSLGLNRQLGPAAAIGVTFAMLAMLTLMPALLAMLGPAVFWPRRTKSAAAQPSRRLRVSQFLLNRPRTIWLATAAGLVILASASLGLQTGQLTDGDMVIGKSVESRLGQSQLDQHFPQYLGSPTSVVVDAADRLKAKRIVGSTSGVTSVSTWTGPKTGGQATPAVVDGRVRLDALLSTAPDSIESTQTVQRLRERLTELGQPGDRPLVGGQAAVRVDFNDAATKDRGVLVLLTGVVLLVVSLLLRSIIGGLAVIASVIVSFFASLGVATLLFQHVLSFPGVDATFPIHAFVFLVALGVDYSIFLMSRVRERVLTEGPRQGVVTGLNETSVVITSAGLVLAATFAALALVPLVLMVQLAFIVAFGILLDTLIVRTLLVPALAIDLGPLMWWPGIRARRRERGRHLTESLGPDISADTEFAADKLSLTK